ncbi:hypothetical protein GCM10027299_21710 [Larkinella ripae]
MISVTTPAELAAAEERLNHLAFRLVETRRGIETLESSNLKPALVDALKAPLCREKDDLARLIGELQGILERMK